MEHDVFLSGLDLDLRSNFPNDLIRSNYTLWTLLDKINTMLAKTMPVSLPSQTLLQKKTFSRKTAIFKVFAL